MLTQTSDWFPSDLNNQLTQPERMTPYPKKLIEVALPLAEINDASAYDKMPGIGPHPKGIHHWWARLPLPVARAVLFASVVDDPESHPEKWPTEEAQNVERERLFGILRKMMAKKLHEAPEVYAEAHAELMHHCDGHLPTVFDPFAGGGSIPLEANRLGFETHAGDLNPVAVVLNKCNLELAPRWAGCSPVNPADRQRIGGAESWLGAHGLAADVRHYGKVIRARAQAQIGHLYPNMPLSKEHGGGDAKIIAWIWARTVVSPNPAAQGKHVPLISTYWLSSKKGALAWLEPVVDKETGNYWFKVRTGLPNDLTAISAGTKMSKGGFRCLLTDAPITFEHIRSEGQRGRLGSTMLAIVAEAPQGRIYVNATPEQVRTAQSATPSGYPDTNLPEEALGFRIQNYGIRKHWEMFTPRQLTAMVTLSDLVKGIGVDVERDGLVAGLSPQEAVSYSRSVMTFLALALSRFADNNNNLCRWRAPNPALINLFARQAIPMVWDFCEGNSLGEAIGSWQVCVEREAACISVLIVGNEAPGFVKQIDAANAVNGIANLLVSTDPPYYDNIGYAALSDFFYVWLRRSIGSLYPELFGTLLVPKQPELIASPERFGGDKQKAKEHFEVGFRKAFAALREKMDSRFPLSVYYAFKQDDEESGGAEETGEAGIDLTTGWETLLDALVSSGFQITATWPVRASQAWRMRAMGSNALASYIVLACRPRCANADMTTRRDCVAVIKRQLPSAVRQLQRENIAPVDLAQAAIGPGMSVFSQYATVLEANGAPMSVRSALLEINRVLDEVMAEQEGDLDADTRFCVAWFEQYGIAERAYGEAEVLFIAKNTSFAGLEKAGVIIGGKGKVRLRRREELDPHWDPRTDDRVTDWKCTQHLVRVMTAEQGGGASEAARLVNAVGPARAENARALAYRLFTAAERKGWAEEALAYNILVTSWPQIQAATVKVEPDGPAQSRLPL